MSNAEKKLKEELAAVKKVRDELNKAGQEVSEKLSAALARIEGLESNIPEGADSYKAELEVALAKIVELETKGDDQEVIDGYKAELEKANGVISKQLEDIEDLSQELAIAKKGASEVKGSSVITSIKKLDKNKSYVTGPSGTGYVEA